MSTYESRINTLAEEALEDEFDSAVDNITEGLLDDYDSFYDFAVTLDRDDITRLLFVAAVESPVAAGTRVKMFVSSNMRYYARRKVRDEWNED